MIVVAGEALIDLIPTPGGDLAVSVGGGPFNTARWLARLGAPASFLGAVAHDLLGERIRQSLVDCGVALRLVIDAPHPTTLALAQLDAAGAARYSFYADATSVRDLTPELVPDAVLDRIEALHVGGVGMTLEPSATAVEQLVAGAHAAGALVMLDPNVRPSLIAERGEYLARLARVLAHTDALKLSVDDLRWIEPEEPVQTAVRALLNAGPRVVLLTDGPSGATVFSRDAVTAVPASQVDVVDTIGAGDAFGAGFLAHWHGAGLTRGELTSTELVVAATRFAATVAGVACAHQGATPPAGLREILA